MKLDGDILKVGVATTERIKWFPAESVMSAREASEWAASGFSLADILSASQARRRG